MVPCGWLSIGFWTFPEAIQLRVSFMSTTDTSPELFLLFGSDRTFEYGSLLERMGKIIDMFVEA